MKRKAWRCNANGVEWIELECERCGAKPLAYFVAHGGSHAPYWEGRCEHCESRRRRRGPPAEYRPVPKDCEYVEIPVPVPSAQRTGQETDPHYEQALAEARALAERYEADQYRGAAILRLAAGLLVPFSSAWHRPGKEKRGNQARKASTQ